MGWTMRGSYDLGERAKGPLGEGGGLLEDVESAKRRIEFRQAPSWSGSWSGRPAKAHVGLAKRQFQRAALGLNPGLAVYSCGSGHMASPLRASASSSAKGLLVRLVPLGEMARGTQEPEV